MNNIRIDNTGTRNTGDWNTGNYNTGSWNTGDRNTGYRNSGNWNTGDYNTGDRNTGARNTGSCNTGSWNTGYRNTGSSNTGTRNTGDWNTGNYNTGSWNTGDRNTGYFNTITPQEILVFNKPCNRNIWQETIKPNWLCFELDLDLPKWTALCDLSEADKLKYPDSEKLGGYLLGGVFKGKTTEEKISEYKEASQKAWRETTEEDRQLTFKLPNFDADVFYEIFGIDVRKKEVEKDLTVEYITVNGKKYKCIDNE